MRFSVIIPAYNAEKFIERSITSVLAQTYTDFEVIVVDDGSEDKTLTVANGICDGRLKILTQSNSGVSVARNTGIAAAIGDYICFLDADDEFLSGHLQSLSDLIAQYPDKAFFCTRACICFTDGTVLQKNCSGKISFFADAVKAVIEDSGLVWTGCVCIKKAAFDWYGGFEPGIRLGEDTDMWKRIYVHTGLVFSDNVTVKRNRDGSEATKSYSRRHDADPLRRMPIFLADKAISDTVKNSLKTEYELSKVEVVRTYLLEGNKKRARNEYKKVNKSRISLKKRLITDFCFFIPSVLLRYYIKKKNSKMYEW